MANLEYCFFCCENILEEGQQLTKTYHTKESSDYINHNDGNSDKAIREHVLQISKFLKVPRELIDQENVAPSIISTCSDCTKISENLSDYCAQMEIIKMKIGYYLNELNNKIVGSSTNADYEPHQQNFNMSDFQKSVHEKCLLKVRNDECSRFPQIQLTKLPKIPGQLEQQLKLGDAPQHPIILEEAEDEIKIETDPIFPELPTDQDIIQELHSCPFCLFVVNGPYEQLQSHISVHHPDQLEIDPDETSSVSTCSENHKNNTNLEKESSSLFKCSKCERTFKHLRKSLICGQAQEDNDYTVNFFGSFQCSNCNRLYSRRDFMTSHLKNVCKTGRIIDRDKNSDKPTKKVATNAPKHKFSKCKYCEMFIYSRNLKRHLDNRHPNGTTLSPKRKEKICEHCNLTVGNAKNLRIHMLAFHGVELPENLYRCGNCNRSYELKTSYFRHLRNYEKCRLFANKGITVKDNQFGRDEREIEKELVLSVSEAGDDDVMIINDEEMSEDEDPLAI